MDKAARRAHIYRLLCEDERRSIRELMRLVRASSTSVVAADLRTLAYEGKITIDPGAARSIRVVRDMRSPEYLSGYAAGFMAAQEKTVR